jgi:pimeloyl-ACP methyl ester carboxylesterase
MGDYVDLTGGRVWYEESGAGEPVVLLHGGAVDTRFFKDNTPALAERLRVIGTDLWGHGRSPDREGPFTLESFSADVAELIERVAGGRAHVVGHSIGAVVALTLAIARPELLDRLVMISGGYDVRAEPPNQMGIDEMVEGTVAFLGSTYGEVSPDGEEHFAVVCRKDFELSAREPVLTATEVGAIGARTLVMAADDDITTLEHQVDMYRAIPNSELAVVPGTSHFLLQEKPALVNAVLLDFLVNDAVPTVAPVRRASAATTGT